MLKFKKINILFLFILLSCLQKNGMNEKKIKLMKKPLKFENSLSKCSSKIVKGIFIAIEELNLVKFNELMGEYLEKGPLDLLVIKNVASDDDGDTMLSAACKKGFLEAVRFMLAFPEFKSVINKENSDGYTPLILAVRLIPYKTSTYNVTLGVKIDLINLLIKKGADIDFKDANEHSIIWHAHYYKESIEGKKEKAKLEIRRLTKPIIQLLKSHIFMTKNLFAETNKDVKDICKFFIEKLYFKNLYFKNLFSKTQDEVDKKLIEDIKSKNLIEIFLLLELFGANPNIAEIETGNTALHIACSKLNEDPGNVMLEIIRLLYKERKIMVKDSEGFKEKLTWGCMDSKNKKGQTPIGLYLDFLTASPNFMFKPEYADLFLSIINHEKNIYRISLEKKIVKLSEYFDNLYLKDIFKIDCKDLRIKDFLDTYIIATILIFNLENYKDQFILLNPSFKFSKKNLHFEDVEIQKFSCYQTKFIIDQMLVQMCGLEPESVKFSSLQKAKGHKEVVETLFDEVGTALIKASQEGKAEVVKLLLDKVEKVDKMSALMTAAKNGHKEVVELLLNKEIKIDEKDKNSCTALHCAAANNQKEIVKLLLIKGADVNVADINGNTPLHLASSAGHLETVELLLKNKADVNCANNDRFTPLHFASMYGYLKIVQLLLNKSANVNSKTKELFTPLHFAIGASRVDKRFILNFLLNYGADLNAKNIDRQTPIDLCTDYETLKLLLIHAVKKENAEAAKSILMKPEDWTEIKEEDESTLLMYAAGGNDLELVKTLVVKEKYKIDAEDSDGSTVLMYAAEGGNTEIIGYLLSLLNAKIYIDKKNKFGSTALLMATSEQKIGAIRLLVEAGADIDVYDSRGRTPLDISGSRLGSEYFEEMREEIFSKRVGKSIAK